MLNFLELESNTPTDVSDADSGNNSVEGPGFGDSFDEEEIEIDSQDDFWDK